MKEIELTQGFKALVDDDDYDKLNNVKWYVKKFTSTNYAKNDLYGLMHRYILNVSKEMIIDHIDHNGLNNQKYNLRICNKSQNKSNCLSGRNSTSKYLGVSISKRYKKTKTKVHCYKYYLAQIRKNGKNIYWKVFKNELDAAKQYDEWAKEVHGEFANLNFK